MMTTPRTQTEPRPRGIEPSAMLTERRSLPTWAWLLVLFPIIGWMIMLVMAISNPTEVAERSVDTSIISHAGRLRAVRRTLLVGLVPLLAVGVGGRAAGADWAPMALAIALVGTPVAWFTTRVIESALLRFGRAG